MQYSDLTVAEMGFKQSTSHLFLRSPLTCGKITVKHP